MPSPASVSARSATLASPCPLHSSVWMCVSIATHPGVEVHNVAISDSEGPVTLHLSANRECNSVDLSIATAFGYRGTVACEGLTLEGFLDRHGPGTIDLLKVDIEGAEGPMFSSTSDAVHFSTPRGPNLALNSGFFG